jgi:hypothetical protein
MKHILTIISLIVLLSSSYNDEQFHQLTSKGKAISLNAEINQLAVTRVNDNGFCDGDAMGIYVVDYSDDNAGELKATGNRANNLRYTYLENKNIWKPDYDVYFKDDKTPVDIYAYYPLGSPEDMSNYAFSVKQNQSTEGGNGEMGGYEASDFLWGKTEKAAPTEAQIKISLQHKLSSARIELIEGNGFADGEWNSLEKNITLKNLKMDCSIDLAVEATKEPAV